MTSNGEVNGTTNDSISSDNDCEDLECLNFPGDIDWSTTVVLRCEPDSTSYSLSDMINALHHVVRRNDVYNLGPTFLNHVFTLSFKTPAGLQNFKFYMKSNKMAAGLRVKGKPCKVLPVPPKFVTVKIRNIPLEIDSAAIVEKLKPYGTVVKTELVRSNFQGWFHVYTNERRIALQLKNNLSPDDIPFGIEVKGLFASTCVDERNPKCLECYYSGHKSDACDSTECILYRK